MIQRFLSRVAPVALAASLAASACETPRADDAHSKPLTGAALPAKPAEKPAAPSGPAAQKPAQQTVVMEQDDDEPAHDGKWLYTRNCEGCHNANGDGQGPTIVAMGQKARSFAQGGFAFGNTKDAIYKTITAGMPGSSVMPSFKATLNDDERHLLAEYVLTLCPKAEEPARGTQLHVEREPQIARGLLPALAEKKPEWPRGLLIGYPEGLTFEYRTDDVRLLAVRHGEFADRTDWNDRGGSPLEPLGKPIYTLGDGDPAPMIQLARGGNQKRAEVRFKRSWARKDSAGLAYQVRDESGAVAAEIQETQHVEGLSVGGAFTRKFSLVAGESPSTLVLTVGGVAAAPEWVRGMPAKWTTDVEFERAPLPADGWVIAQGEDSFECLHIEAPANVQLVRDPGRIRLLVPLFVDKDQKRPPSQIKVTVVMCSEWTEEKLAKLAQEIAR